MIQEQENEIEDGLLPKYIFNDGSYIETYGGEIVTVNRKVEEIEMRIKLDEMPFDHAFNIDGNEQLCHATGYVVCLGDSENPADWWNEYEDVNGDLHYGR